MSTASMSMDTASNLPAVSGGNIGAQVTKHGLDQYIREIQKFPILEPEEEYMLAKRYVEHTDMSAAHRLVTSHLRLVVKIAHGFKGYGLPLAEMVSEGNIGLMQAVKKFDPERGVRLSTYAIWWVRASIQEYVLRSWSFVKVGTSAAQKKLFFNLKRLKQRMSASYDKDLTPDQIAEISQELGVSKEDVVAMNHRMIASDRPLNARMSQEGDSGEWVDALADERDTQDVMLLEYDERKNRQAMLQAGLDTLNERERDILMARRMEEPATTLEVLSQKHGISRERVRQIENRAFEKLQQAVQANAQAQEGALAA